MQTENTAHARQMIKEGYGVDGAGGAGFMESSPCPASLNIALLHTIVETDEHLVIMAVCSQRESDIYI